MHEVDNENDLFPVTRASEISGESVSQSWLIEDLWTSSAVGWIAGTPKSYKSWTALEMAVSWAESIGPSTAQLVSSIMASRPHPEQGFRACLGILRLSKRDGAERLEKASLRAVLSGSLSFRSVDSILKNGLEDEPLPERSNRSLPKHDNVRGSDYYNFN